MLRFTYLIIKENQQKLLYKNSKTVSAHQEVLIMIIRSTEYPYASDRYRDYYL